LEQKKNMLKFYGKEFSSRLLIGSALYPSPKIMQDAIRAAGSQIVTVSVRRESAGGKTGDQFWSLIRELGVSVLPNTAGCKSVREAVTTAKLARELFNTPWIKLEVIADDETLQPDVVGLVEAANILIKDGFEVFPYCTEDLSVASRLVDAGCKVVMPWASPIGSARGITNRDALKLLRARFLTLRWWSMPGSARRRTPPKPSNSAMTPCCSTPPSPRPTIPSPWAAPSVLPPKRDAQALKPA
jgi:thiazole synthase